MSRWSVHIDWDAAAAGCTATPMAFRTPFTEITEEGVDCLATNAIPSVIFSTANKSQQH